jgi:hypothetical protein
MSVTTPELRFGQDTQIAPFRRIICISFGNVCRNSLFDFVKK